MSRGSCGRGGSGSVDKGEIVSSETVNKSEIVNKVDLVEGSVVCGDAVDVAPGGHKFTKNYKGDKNYVPGREFYEGMDLVTLDKLEKIKLKSHIENCKRKIERSMVSMFGSVEAMDMFIEHGTGKVRYTFECPIEGCDFRGNNLSRHLSAKRHVWSVQIDPFMSCPIV